MPRVNVKTTSKFYDEMSANDWNLKFEYELVNGVIAGTMSANGTKSNSSLLITKDNNQVQTIFSNGTYDPVIVTTVMAEFAAIIAEQTPE